MKTIALVSATLLSLGCSASHEQPDCAIAGTYTMTAERESGACEEDPDAGLTPAPEALTVTISASGVTRPPFTVALQGATGSCPGELVDACKLQTKCTFIEKDPLDPSNADGTLQFSWTFDAAGFKGINSVSLPPARSAPRGCAGTSRATGVRR